MPKGPHQSKIVSAEPIFANFPQGKLKKGTPRRALSLIYFFHFSPLG